MDAQRQANRLAAQRGLERAEWELEHLYGCLSSGQQTLNERESTRQQIRRITLARDNYAAVLMPSF